MTGIDWARVYAEQYDRVFAVVYRRVSGDRRLAEDLTQDAFVRAIRAERQWTDEGRGIGPWLTRIAVNLVIDHFKSPRLGREIPTEDMRHADTRVVASVEETVLRRAEFAGRPNVKAALRRLTEQQAEALYLQYWEDWTDERIAARLGRQVGAVKTLKYRARQSLARHLAAA